MSFLRAYYMTQSSGEAGAVVQVTKMSVEHEFFEWKSLNLPLQNLK